MNLGLKKKTWRVLAWLGTITVILLCYLPAPSLPSPGLPHVDKFEHVLAFFAIGLAWRLSGLSVRSVLLLGLGVILLTEIGQALLPTGRTGDVLDALSDAAGLAAGLLLAPRIERWAVRRT